MATQTTTSPTRTSPLQRLSQRLGLTTRPETFGEQYRNSAAVWLALMMFWAVSDVIVAVFPPSGRSATPDGVLHHLIWTLAGLAAIWLMHRTGFPAAWDARFPARERLLLPLLIGAATGVYAIGMELAFGLVRNFEQTTGLTVTIGFPQSILVYSSVAALLELRFLLLPVPLLLWLISTVALQGRGQTPTFWALAVFSSCVEIGLQAIILLGPQGSAIAPTTFVLFGLGAFAANFGAAVMFRRYGLLAAVLVRVGNYLVWHILFGNFFL